MGRAGGGRKAQGRQELLQLRTGLGLCHQGCIPAVCQGRVEAAAILEPRSWRLSMFRGLKAGPCEAQTPDHLGVGAGLVRVIDVDLSQVGRGWWCVS